MSSVSIDDIADKVGALWKICRNVEVHQHRCTRIHRCARDMLDTIQDMEGELGLDLVISDISSTIDHALQALKQWESISPYQALVDEGRFIACIETELKLLGECELHHVFGLEQQWSTAYIRAKARDEVDLEDKLLKVAEEDLEPDVDGTHSRAQTPPPVTPPASTAMERLLAEGFKRSRMNQISVRGEAEPDTTGFNIEALAQEYNDSVQMTSQYQPPLLVPNDLSPVIAPLAQDLVVGEEKSADPDSFSMHQVTHVPFVTISDINKMEDAHYLHNIRDLSLQTRLYGGHPMRRNGSVMTYLGCKVEDGFNLDTVGEKVSLLRRLDSDSLVAVRLCQPNPKDQLLYSMMQR
ncbi:hypothetical protein FRC12_015521, partial [Ceratobasidium sp. 428]